MYIRNFLYFLYFFPIFGFSQAYFIDGVVKDEEKKIIAYANVVLENALDGTIIKGTTTDESGYFYFDTIEPRLYTLKISFLGYMNYDIKIELTNNVSLQEITLYEQVEHLDGIVVTAKRPTLRRLVDRLVFNVENSTLSNGNVLDVLKQTPGVLIADDKVKIKQKAPVIYMNDRRVHLSSSEVLQLLEGTSANNIKSIEVITSPPAKYEAEGGAVLNIVTSKNIISGYNGSLFGTYKQGHKFPKYSVGTSHFFKTKKLNTYLNYSISPRKDFRDNDEFVNFIEDNQITSSWQTYFRRIKETANQNISANIDYQLDKKNSLGFSTNMLFSPRADTQTNSHSVTDVFNREKVLDSTFITDNSRVDETFNLAFTLDYLHKFKKSGETLSANLHYTNYNSSSFQNVDTDYLFPNRTLIRNNRFQTFSSQEIKLYTGQLDYELPVSESVLFLAGGKISNINSESILNQFNFENDIREPDIENSDTFFYDETNYALYSSISSEWDSWNLKFGLRGEFTDIVGNSISTNEVNSFEYLKLFPSLYISYHINDSNEIYLNYDKRIYRPRYQELNPFKFFLNDNTFIIGDPNLQPQIDNQVILGYTFNKDYTFELYYRHEEDPTLQYFYQDNDSNLLVYQFTNTDDSISFGLDFTTYVSINDFWSLYGLSSIFYYRNNFTPIASNQNSFVGEQWSVYAEVINYFSLLKDKSMLLDVSFNYISPTNDGPSDTSFISSLDLNLRKTFWNNKASLNLGVVDILNTKNFDATTRYLNQDIFSKFRFENRLFVFGFNYKFGNSKLKNNRKSIDLNERNRLGNDN